MDCGHVDPLLSAWLDGEVTRLTSLRIRRHLRACDDCTDEADSLRRTRALLRAIPPRRVPEGLWEGAVASRPSQGDRAPSVTPSPQPRRRRQSYDARGRVVPVALVAVTAMAVAPAVRVGLGGPAPTPPMVVAADAMAGGHAAVTGADGVPRPLLDVAPAGQPSAATSLLVAAAGVRAPVGEREVLVMDYRAGESTTSPEVARMAVAMPGGPAPTWGVDPELKYDLVVAGEQPVMDRMCVRIEAHLTDGGLREVIYLDDATGEILRRETYDTAGSTLARLTTYLAIDDRDVSAAVRAPDGPAPRAVGGLGQRAALRAAGWWLPQMLPGGYRLLDVLVHPDLPGMPLQGVYGDGLFTVSLFSQPGRAPLLAPTTARKVAMADGRVLLEWPPSTLTRMLIEGDGFVHTLTGDAPRDEMLRLAAAIPGPAR